MNKIKLTKSSLKKIEPILSEFLKSLTDITDDFWEDHIINADIYEIQKDAALIGFFSIFGGEKLTSFYVFHEHLNEAQDIFQQILTHYKVQTAFVATCDKLFLNLCLDFHKKIEMQAYIFDGTKIMPVREPEYRRELVSEINPEEIAEINAKTDDFFGVSTPEEYLKNGYRVFRLADNGEDLGYGLIFKNKLIPAYYSCGMVTMPRHRQKGVGRSIQLHMADIINESGGIPVSACWYHNINSKRTIESAGRYSTVRLLNVWFVEK